MNISTIKVFSHRNRNPITADTDPCPMSPYGIAKVTAEKFFEAYFDPVAPHVVHLRLCAVASPGEHPSQLLSQLYVSAYEQRPIRINIGHEVCLIYLDDVVDVIINAMLQADKPRYIVASPGVAMAEIVSVFERMANRQINAVLTDFTPGLPDPIFVSDLERLQSDWTRYTSLPAMIEKMIQWRRHDVQAPSISSFHWHRQEPPP